MLNHKKAGSAASLLLAMAVACSGASAQTMRSTLLSAWQPLGGPQFQNWTGLQTVKAAGKTPSPATATLKVPGEAEFRYPQLKEGETETDAQRQLRDLFNAYGVRFDVQLADDRPVQLDVKLMAGPNATASTTIAGKGWHTVSLAWKNFDFRQKFAGFLSNVQGLDIAARFDGGGTGQIALRSPHLVRGDKVWLQQEIVISNLESDGENTSAAMTESKDGQVLQSETAHG